MPERLDDKFLDQSLAVKGRQKAADGGMHRMFKFIMQTEHGDTFVGIEYRRFANLSEMNKDDAFMFVPSNGN